jgi:hypothetical protein
VQYVLVKRKVDGPSIPELGTPVALTFDSVRVPLNRPSTGPNLVSAYELERSTDGSAWTVIATGASIFGNPPAQYVDGGRLASTTYHYRARTTDTGGRVSAYCATVSVTTPAGATGSLYRNTNNEVGYYLQGSWGATGGLGNDATTRANAAKADWIMLGASAPSGASAEATMVAAIRAVRSGVKLIKYTEARYWYDDALPASDSPYREAYATINLNGAPALWSAKNAAGATLAHSWSPSNTNAINLAAPSSSKNSLGQTLPQAFAAQFQAMTQWSLYDGVFLDDSNIIPNGLVIRGTSTEVNWSYLQNGADADFRTDWTFGDAWRAGLRQLVDAMRSLSSSFLTIINADHSFHYLQYRYPFDWSAGGRPPTPFSGTAYANLVDISGAENPFSARGFGVKSGANYRIGGDWTQYGSALWLQFELYRQHARQAADSRMGAQIGFHIEQMQLGTSATATQTDIAYARACWAMTKLCEGAGYGNCRNTLQPFFLDETCLQLGNVVNGPRSMGTLNQPGADSNEPCSFTVRTPDLATGAGRFFWAQFDNALVVWRGDNNGLTPGGSNFGEGSPVSYTLPSAGAGLKWRRPNCQTYVHPQFADLAMQGQSPSLNNGADATTSSLLPLHGEVFLRVAA